MMKPNNLRLHVVLCAAAMIAGCIGNPTEESAIAPGEWDFSLEEPQSEDTELDNAEVEAPAKDAAEPPQLIRNEQGRIRYIIEFRDDAAKDEPSHGARDSRFADFHNLRTLNFVRSTEKRHGIRAVSMTSLVGLTMTAYLTDEQVEMLEADPKVERISADHVVEFSAPLWTDSGSAEKTPWGKKAINSSTANSNGTARVHVLDAGVGYHDDLNVVQRVNAMQPAVQETDTANKWKLVGCYPHATHVAGIIGAKVGNGGTQGVLPGASIVSVSVLDPMPSGAKHPTANCNQGQMPDSAIIAGLDWIKNDILTRGKVGVVNISLNTKDGKPNEFSSIGIIGSKIKSLATPATGYPGALVVQSAGNYFKNACTYAYGPAVINDGILVAGAVNDHAQPVVPLNGLPGFRNGSQAGSQAGSNYGACVEVWAPGANVYSTWANDPQNASTTYATYSNLSGTSMAAPHVAGLAARFLEVYGAAASTALESKVRTALYALNSKDKAGLSLSMPSANPPTGTGPRSTPYAEFAISATPFKPRWASLNNNANLLPSTDAFPNGSVNVGYGAPMTYLSLDTWGAPAGGCDAAYRLTSGGSNSSLGTGIVTRDWAGLTMSQGNWTMYSNACPSAKASVSATTPAPVVKWLVDNVDQTGKTLDLSVSSTANIKFTSQYATSCSGSIAIDATTSHLDGGPSYVSISGLTGTYTLNPTPAHMSFSVECSGSMWKNTAKLTIVTTGLPTSGTWLDSAKPAWSWDLSQNIGGQVALAWYTFTPSGTPTWYMAVLNPKSVVYDSYNDNYAWTSWFEGTLDHCTWNGSAATCVPRGSVKFTPTDASAGKMDWTLDGAAGTTNLSRLVFAGAPTSPNLTGHWYATSQSGWGESFDVQGNKMLANILLYDTTGQPTWVSSSYGTWNGTAYSTSLFRDSGINACPACIGAQSASSSQVGTITVSGINGGATTAALSLSFLTGSNLTQWDRPNLAIGRLTK